jgi:hypothetical protein
MRNVLAASIVIGAVVWGACAPRDELPSALDTSKPGRNGPFASAPPPPTPCSPNVLVSGATAYDQRNLAAGTQLDARAAQFKITDPDPGPDHYFPIVLVGGGDGICWSGGEILGQYAPSFKYWNGMHDKYAMLPGHDATGRGIHVENLTTFDYGDGISFDHADAGGWIISGVHIKYSRDDCIEDDAYQSGTIDGSFLDGCYSGVSARDCYLIDHPNDPNCDKDGSDSVITMNQSLVRLQSMDIVYDESQPDTNGVGPEHNGFWKWKTLAPRLRLYNNRFRADGPSLGDANETIFPPSNKVDPDCTGNVLDWFGDPNNPPAIPSGLPAGCFQVKTTLTGAQADWDAAVASWQSAHPDPLTDVASPIVSMFRPGLVPLTMTGSVTLIATAADDRGVANVSFQLADQSNTYSLGSVTQDGASGDATSANGYTGPTKYQLPFNTADLGNGSYTLTATARDTRGFPTTSAPITVNLSNPPPPQLLAPTNCQNQRVPPAPQAPVYLKITWTNSGQPFVQTEVSVLHNGFWTVVPIQPNGTTTYFYNVQNQHGDFTAEVRHVKNGFPSSNYCTTSLVTLP